MAANGISTLSTKQLRQEAKLELAKLKREGYTLNADGTVAGGPDITAIFYRERNSYDITELPTQYDSNDVIDNPNVGGLVLGRPWIVPTIGTDAILMETGDDLLQETNDQLFIET